MKKTLTGLLRPHYASEFNSWEAMKARCYKINDAHYHHYGGRGIKVCKRWRYSFPTFLEDMGPKPGADYTLDRYPDKNGDYKPSNCRWATKGEQARNKINNKWFTYKNRSMILADWAKELKRHPEELNFHLKRGKPFNWIYKNFKSIINRPPRRRWITYKGKTKMVTDWSRELKISTRRLIYWLDKGYDLKWIVQNLNKN